MLHEIKQNLIAVVFLHRFPVQCSTIIIIISSSILGPFDLQLIWFW